MYFFVLVQLVAENIVCNTKVHLKKKKRFLDLFFLFKSGFNLISLIRTLEVIGILMM